MGGGRTKLSAAERAIASLDASQEFEPELTIEAMRLLTFNGWVNRVTKLLESFASGGDRDELAAMNGEHKTLKLLSEIHAKVLEHQLDAEGTRKLQELLDQIGRRESGATTSFDGGFNPPTAPDKGAH